MTTQSLPDSSTVFAAVTETEPATVMDIARKVGADWTQRTTVRNRLDALVDEGRLIRDSDRQPALYAVNQLDPNRDEKISDPYARRLAERGVMGPAEDDDRHCPLCGADIVGNDPHGDGCPQGYTDDPAYLAHCEHEWAVHEAEGIVGPLLRRGYRPESIHDDVVVLRWLVTLPLSGNVMRDETTTIPRSTWDLGHETRPCGECARDSDPAGRWQQAVSDWPQRLVVETFTTNPADPTTAYKLACGHSTIDL